MSLKELAKAAKEMLGAKDELFKKLDYIGDHLSQINMKLGGVTYHFNDGASDSYSLEDLGLIPPEEPWERE